MILAFLTPPCLDQTYLTPHSCGLRRTDPQVLTEIVALLDRLPPREVADRLNRRKRVKGSGLAFTAVKGQQLCANYGMRKRYHRLREKGVLTQAEIAERLGLCRATVLRWRHVALLHGHVFSDKRQCLYEDPGDPRRSSAPDRTSRSASGQPCSRAVPKDAV